MNGCNDDAGGLPTNQTPFGEPRPAWPPGKEEETLPPYVPDEEAPRAISGTLLVAGSVQPIATTDDGHLAMFRATSGGADLQMVDVLDVATKGATSAPLPVRVAGPLKDARVLVRGKAVALWTQRSGALGAGALTVWTKASGPATAPGNPSSLAEPGYFAVDATGTRIAFTYGAPTDPFAVTNIVQSSPTFAPAAQIVAANVGLGTPASPCKPIMSFAGERLVTSSCEGTGATATVRVIEAGGQVTVVRADARNVASVDSAGSKVFVVGATGDAEVHALPQNDVVAIAAGVRSGALSPDGATVVYTTDTGALKRASVADPAGSTIELASSGAREILALSPTFEHAIVAVNGADNQNPATPRYELRLVSLTQPSQTVALTTDATGVPYGFSKTGSHVLYVTDVPAAGLNDIRIRARGVTAGAAEVVLGQNITHLSYAEGNSRVVFDQRRTDGYVDTMIIDLAAGTPPKLVIDRVRASHAFGSALFVAVGSQGLYSMVVP